MNHHSPGMSLRVLRSILYVTVGAALLGVLLAITLGPTATAQLLSRTPLFQLVAVRVFLTAGALYAFTGDPHLSLFAGILFNNLTSALLFLSIPLVARGTHLLHLRSRGVLTDRGANLLTTSVRNRLWAVRASSIAVPAVVAFGMGVSALVSGPKLFMAVEMSAVVMAALVVLNSPKIDSPNFTSSYLHLLTRSLPVVVILLALAAAIEVSELLGPASVE
ncbi:MAG: hypothetical protein NZ957_04885 [Thaumarchaeota archaeon]|nr:hypothetical protein [Candidatus Calditenuaceae archaeon]MDW8042543.1 hypothetical protein [Nitrososphaerota archaeon]